MSAVAVFKTNNIIGEAVATQYRNGVYISLYFTKLPHGKHGIHIHKAGDLRGEGCHGLCEHYDIGNNSHGGKPGETPHRHLGDLGNIEIISGKSYTQRKLYLPDISVEELWGRSLVIHEKEDDLGKGIHDDSKTTGHSGARIGCAIFGRGLCKPKYSNKNHTRKQKK